jgi:hypothetical protein
MLNDSEISSKILVCYLFTKFDDESSLIKFIDNYKKMLSGLDHDLLICFKLLDKNRIDNLKIYLKNIKYIEYIDNSEVNDYDLGSYKRVAKDFSNRIIFFLNSHSYPVSNYWLKKIFDHYQLNSIIATTASYESILSSTRLNKFYKVISFLFKIKRYKKKFYSFPNPHIRTTGFLIKSNDFLMFMKNNIVITKEDAWSLESGKNSLTNFFKNKNYNIFVVNSDGEKFSETEWPFSETYNYLDQSKSIISDKHTRKYVLLDKVEKKICQFKTWGI